MKDDGIEPYLHLVGRLPAAELDSRIIIAHHDSESEVSGHGEKRPGDAHVEPGTSGRQHIHQVLEAGEAKAYRRGIYQPVIPLVELRALTQK